MKTRKSLLISIIIFIVAFSCQKSKTAEKYENQIVSKTFTYKQIGDLKIQADLYKIKNDKSLKPVIIWIHGGALIFGSRKDILKEQMELYVKAGYSVISIDYRLAPETKLPEIAEDIKDAIEWVRNSGEKELGIDTKKVFVIGHSAGAYLAQMTGYILETPPQGIVSFYGYSEIIGDWYNKPDSFYNTWDKINKEDAYKLVNRSVITTGTVEDRYDFYVHCRQYGTWTKEVSDNNMLENWDLLNYYSPIENIHSKFPPTFLIHGDKDTDVPFSQSTNMNEELAFNNIEHKLITMKGSDHLFDIMEGGFNNKNIYLTFKEVIQFLNKH